MKGESKFWRWSAIIFFSGLGLVFLKIFLAEIKLSQNHRYTICITKEKDLRWVKYSFIVNGVTYEGKTSGLKSHGSRYFIKFYPSDPSLILKIASYEEVPDCIGEPPSDGWKEIPKCQ